MHGGSIGQLSTFEIAHKRLKSQAYFIKVGTWRVPIPARIFHQPALGIWINNGCININHDDS